MAEFHSKNFKLSEFTASNTATKNHIDNTRLTESEKINIANLICNVLQPCRDKVGFPMTITSGRRCKALNKIVGGADNSQHLCENGAASDIQCFTNKKFDVQKTRQVFQTLSEMDVDQLFYEKDQHGTIWVHVSYVSPEKNRHYIKDNFMVVRK